MRALVLLRSHRCRAGSRFLAIRVPVLDNYAVLFTCSEEMSWLERRASFGDARAYVSDLVNVHQNASRAAKFKQEEPAALRFHRSAQMSNYDRSPAGSLASPFYTDHDSLLLPRVLA